MISTRSSTILVILAGCAATFIFIALEAGDTSSTDPLPLDRVADDNRAEGGVASVPPWLYDPWPAPVSRVSRNPADAGEALLTRITGEVSSAAGPVADAIVYSRMCRADGSYPKDTDPDRPPVPPLTTTKTGPDGTFELQLPLRLKPYCIDVGVFASGFTVAHKTAVPVPCDPPLLFALSAGSSIRGVVVADMNEPIPRNLSVTAFGGEARFLLGKLIKAADLSADDRKLADRHGGYCSGNSLVDDLTGEFEVTGLVDGRYRLACRPLSYIIDPEVVVDAGTNNVIISIRPAVYLILEVEDQAGLPVAPYRCLLTVGPTSFPGQRKSLVMSSKDGILESTIPLPSWYEPGSLDLPWTVQYSVRPDGYELYTGSVEWIPRDGPCHILQTISPPDYGTVRIEIQRENGGAVDGVVGELNRVGSPEVIPVQLKREGPFMWTARVPMGNWYLGIHEEGLLSYPNRILTEVRLEERDARVLVTNISLPLGGTVAIVNQGDDVTGVLANSERYSRLLEIDPGRTELTAVPAGVWEFTAKGKKAQIIEVLPGSVHTIYL